MSSSTLDLSGEEEPVTGLGHGTRALGPSDSSDTGSDVVGGPGMDEGLSDEQARRMPLSTTHGAGRDLGDADLDSDSDRAGTGERGSSGLDTSPVDQQMSLRPGIESAADELDDPDAIDDVDAETERNEGGASVSDGAT
jgi:hypothetical protein